MIVKNWKLSKLEEKFHFKLFFKSQKFLELIKYFIFGYILCNIRKNKGEKGQRYPKECFLCCSGSLTSFSSPLSHWKPTPFSRKLWIKLQTRDFLFANPNKQRFWSFIYQTGGQWLRINYLYGNLMGACFIFPQCFFASFGNNQCLSIIYNTNWASSALVFSLIFKTIKNH